MFHKVIIRTLEDSIGSDCSRLHERIVQANTGAEAKNKAIAEFLASDFATSRRHTLLEATAVVSEPVPAPEPAVALGLPEIEVEFVPSFVTVAPLVETPAEIADPDPMIAFEEPKPVKKVVAKKPTPKKPVAKAKPVKAAPTSK